MNALVHTLRDLGVGFLYGLVGFYILGAFYLLFSAIPVWAERLDRWHLRRTQNRELQQRVEDWPRPVRLAEDPVDFGAAISGKDFEQFHLQGSSDLWRAG